LYTSISLRMLYTLGAGPWFLPLVKSYLVE